jgi:hypothetical protein
MTKSSNGWLSGAVVVLVLSAFCSPILAAEFSADMIVTERGNTVNNKIFVKDSNYRMETTEDGMEIIVIVDQGANLSRVLNVNEKAYIEMPCDDMRSLTNDPFQALKTTLDTPGIEKKDQGAEEVDGLKCSKTVLLWGGSTFYTYWIAEKYDFPIKIILGEGEKIVELKNIDESAVDDGLFELPEGYLAMKESQPASETQPEPTKSKFPEWVVDVPSVKVMTLPFEQVMSTGDIVRIKVKDGYSIFIQATNQVENSDFLAVPFLNGEPTMDPSIRAINLTMNGQFWPVTAGETPSEADEIVVRVDKGTVNVKAEYNAK